MLCIAHTYPFSSSGDHKHTPKLTLSQDIYHNLAFLRWICFLGSMAASFSGTSLISHELDPENASNSTDGPKKLKRVLIKQKQTYFESLWPILPAISNRLAQHCNHYYRSRRETWLPIRVGLCSRTNIDLQPMSVAMLLVSLQVYQAYHIGLPILPVIQQAS